MLAMIYFVFFSVNASTYWCLINLQNFLAVLQRIADVFELEENTRDKKDEVYTKKEVNVKFEDASFSWGFKVKES